MFAVICLLLSFSSVHCLFDRTDGLYLLRGCGSNEDCSDNRNNEDSCSLCKAGCDDYWSCRRRNEIKREYALCVADCEKPYTYRGRRKGDCCSLCEADCERDWSYKGRNGPKCWGEVNCTCCGTEQSPIDINTKVVKKLKTLEKLDLQNYNKAITWAKIENDGETITVVPQDNVERFIVIKGCKYTLVELHFHWGYYYDEGSEHTLDGRQYAMELHFVHLNEKNEIAVVGVIFQESICGNEELQKIVDVFPHLKYKGSERTLEWCGIRLDGMVPENPASYYRYQGSLTTPPCSEGVTWSVLTDIMAVSFEQMCQFRQLLSVEKKDDSVFCGLSGNYRPVQPLNGRRVYRSQ